MTSQKPVRCQRCGHRWQPRTPRRPAQCPACHSAYWDRRPRRNPREGVAPFALAFAIMNDLRRRRIIQDWAIYGATAFIYWAEVVATRDVDIFILTRTEEDASLPQYRKVLSAIEEYTPVSRKDAGTFSLQGRLLQVFQARGDPFWEDVVAKAVRDEVSGEPVKVATREHLVLLALRRNDRAKDWPRLAALWPQVDRGKVEDLFRRFDDGTLRARLERILPWLDG